MAGQEKIDALIAALENPPAYWVWDFGESYPDRVGDAVAGCAQAMAIHLRIASATDLSQAVGTLEYERTFMAASTYDKGEYEDVTREMVLARLKSLPRVKEPADGRT